MEVRKRKRGRPSAAAAAAAAAAARSSNEEEGTITEVSPRQALLEQPQPRPEEECPQVEEQVQQEQPEEEAAADASVDFIWRSVTKSVLKLMGLPFLHEDCSVNKQSQGPAPKRPDMPDNLHMAMQMLAEKRRNNTYEKQLTIHYLYDRMVHLESEVRAKDEAFERGDAARKELVEQLSASMQELASIKQEAADGLKAIKQELVAAREQIIKERNEAAQATAALKEMKQELDCAKEEVAALKEAMKDRAEAAAGASAVYESGLQKKVEGLELENKELKEVIKRLKEKLAKKDGIINLLNKNRLNLCSP